MPDTCRISGCKTEVPAELRDERLCVAHYLAEVDVTCTGLRRETSLNPPSNSRHAEVQTFIARSGERLAQVATSGVILSDAVKARILNTFLTLMNLRESMDRALHRGDSRSASR